MSAAAIAAPGPDACDDPPARREPVPVLGGIAVFVLVLLLAAIALQRVGTPPEILLRYAGYWFGYIALPGCLLAATLLPAERRPLDVFLIGCALGYAVEMGAWALTAELNIRPALFALPAVVASGTVPVLVLRRRRTRREPGRQTRPGKKDRRPLGWSLGVGIAVLASALTTGLLLWLSEPWPLPPSGGDWTVDLVNHLGWAADAVRHFPPSNPSVAGVTQQYHWFTYGHLAAAHQISGVDLPWLVFRLDQTPMAMLFPALLGVTATRLSGRPLAGPVAAVVGTVAGELDLSATPSIVALGCQPYCAFYSPSYLYSVVLLAPTLLLVADLLADGSARPWRRPHWWGRWLVVTALLACAAGVKATVLPLVVGGFAVAGLYTLIRRRAALPAVLLGGGIAGTVFLAAQTVLYGGSSPERIVVSPLFLFFYTRVAKAFDAALTADGMGSTLAAWLGGLSGLAVLLAPYVGAIALLRRHAGDRNAGDRNAGERNAGDRNAGERGTDRAAGTDQADGTNHTDGRAGRAVMLFLLGVALAGFALGWTVRDPANSQHWFIVTGMSAVAILAGWGTADLAARMGRSALAIAAMLSAGAGAAAWWAGHRWVADATRYPPPKDILASYAVALGVAAGAVMAGLTLGWLLHRRPLAGGGLFLVAVLLGGSLANAPLQVDFTVDRYRATGTGWLPDPKARYRHDVSPDLMAALRWLRDNTGDHDVVAVNNQCLIVVWPDGSDGCLDPRIFVYSAFSERRYVLESWTYTDEAYAAALTTGRSYLEVPSPFAERSSLNDRAFTEPTQQVLDELYRRYDTRYLLADTRPTAGQRPPTTVSPALADLADTVFTNPDATVYRLRPPR